MSNTFITPSMVARDAAITIDDRLVVGNLVNRDKQAVFTGSKVGDTVKVTVPPAISDASEFTGTTSAGDVAEKSVDLTLEKHFYKRIDLTTKQKSLELSDFTRLVSVPAIQGIADSIDKYITRKMQVFRANLTGTVGNRPSTLAHIVAATQKLNDLKLIRSGRVALIDSTVESSFMQLPAFISLDHGPDAAGNIREGMLGRRYGFNFSPDTNLGAFSRSAAANDLLPQPGILTDGAVTAGSNIVHIDTITSATGTIYAGTVFTLAGDTTRYVVAKDATIANNETDLEVYPAVAAGANDGVAVTFEAAGFSNLVYHPNAISAAIVAPAPLNNNSSVQTFNGVSIRVSMDSSITTLADSIVYDVFVGARVVEPNGGALFCG